MKTFHIVSNVSSTTNFFNEMELPIVKAKQADIHVYSGNVEVSPTLYKENSIFLTEQQKLTKQDKYELGMFYRFPDKEKIGIGRGAQFLFIMNGGRLWQSMNNHLDSHKMYTKDKKQLNITSSHTATMRHDINKQNPYNILASAYVSTVRKAYDTTINTPRDNPTVLHNEELEVVWFPKTKTLCFQPLPQKILLEEPSEADCETCYYFFDLIEQYFDLKEKT